MAKEQFKMLSKTDDEKGKDIVDYFMDIYNQHPIAADVNFIFQINKTQKQLCKFTKIPDQYSVIINADILVQFREEYFDHFDEDIKNILIEEQINRVSYNLDKGTFKLEKENFINNKGLVDKFGYDDVKHAHEHEETFEAQLKEMKKENKI